MADTASVVKGVAALQDELEKTRDRLRGVDETIKKLTGRDPSENRPGQRRIVRTPDISRGVELGRGRERIFALARYGVDNDRGPPAKRQVVQSAFGRLGPHLGFNRPGPRRDRDSGDEDDLPRKVTLHSSVVVTPKETRTRTDTLAAQNEDATGKARNRRMFGLLLGTLQRFRDDEKLKVEKEEKRKAVELKVEERAKQDKENLRRERQNLFNKRKAEQAHMRAIQHKMELVEIHEEWEVQTKQLMKFIRTKTTPHIFYLPKVPSPATDNKLKDTHDALQEIITERRKQLEEEIDEVTCHDTDTMEAGDTNHTMGDSVVKTVDTRQGHEGASVGGHSDGGDDAVDQVEKDSDNEGARSSSDEGESRGAGPQGDGPHRKWENSNGDSIGDDKGAHLDEDAGKQRDEQGSSSDSESGEDEKHVAGDEPNKERDTGDKEKEDSHRDEEETHVDKEEGHRDKDGHSGDECADKEDSHQHKEEENTDKEDKHKDKEDKHTDKEDKHVDKEERHKHREDKHRDKEVKHRDKEERRKDKEDRRKDKEDRRRDKEDKHRDKEDRHRDKDGSHRHHSHKSSRDSRKVKDSSRKRAHSESEGDSDDAHDRRRRTSESLSEKTKALKPARRGSGEISEDDNATKKEGGDQEKAAGDKGVEKGEARTAVHKEEAMED